MITVTLAALNLPITFIIVSPTGQQSPVHCLDHHPSVGSLTSEAGSVVSFDDRLESFTYDKTPEHWAVEGWMDYFAWRYFNARYL
jgi:hypothetical protein